jgi:hypothetical protein
MDPTITAIWHIATGMIATHQSRARQARRRNERGLAVFEWAIIAAVVITLATAFAVLVTKVWNDKKKGIK